MGDKFWSPRPLWASGRGPLTQKKVGVHIPIRELSAFIVSAWLSLPLQSSRSLACTSLSWRTTPSHTDNGRPPPRKCPLAAPSRLTRPRSGCLTPGSTHMTLHCTLAGLVCSLIVVALFAPRRFLGLGSRKRLRWGRYVAGPDPDFC